VRHRDTPAAHHGRSTTVTKIAVQSMATAPLGPWLDVFRLVLVRPGGVMTVLYGVVTEFVRPQQPFVCEWWKDLHCH
jgi:hypothetical protein